MLKHHAMQLLNDPCDIVLADHGVIEAHAGTGKTYTIEKLVLRILQQKRGAGYIHIREVLLVTYTDKAAGELKTRIREGIQGTLDDLLQAGNRDLALQSHLASCLNNLHEALIGTIHSVCLRLLQSWPFETGLPFGTEMVDDAAGLEEVLHTCIRTEWQNPATGIPAILEWMRQNGLTVGEAELTKMTVLAQRLLDKDHTVLDREALTDKRLPQWQMELQENHSLLENVSLRAAFVELLEQLRSLVQSAPAPAKFSADAVARWEQIPADCARLLKQPICACADIKRLNVYKQRSTFTTAEFKKIAQVQKFAELYDALLQSPWYLALQMKEALQDSIVDALVCDAAELARDRWLARKESEGLLSFQDMLRLMEKAVDNGAFREALRGRLRFGIIDEFQDTSVLQWNIFRTLFLEKPPVDGPRLYLVGDPKQSIYSFQGADVRTYMDAKQTLLAQGGRLYGLVRNFRSTPELIAGYNTVLGAAAEMPDWFVLPGVTYPEGNAGGELASAPLRAHVPGHTLCDSAGQPLEAVQVLLLEGSADQRRRVYAREAARVIRSLHGRRVSLPKGKEYEERALDYQDFAVVVEGHAAAEPFLEELQRYGIPAAKYKMQGVFQSPMALDLLAMLRAIDDSVADASLRLSALLTRFYNLHPTAIIPEQDLADGSVLALDLAEWTHLRTRRAWGRLLHSLMERTHVAQRLVLLADGQRHLADLRQLCDYALERLVRDNLGLDQLIEHLQMLYDQKMEAGQDQNLHVLATGANSVKVLTMHASKGLEFPIVFVAPASSQKPNRDGLNSWIGDDRRQLVSLADSETLKERFAADHVGEGLESWRLLGKTAAKDGKRLDLGEAFTKYAWHQLQQTQERRRLLYVALTRPQLLLFVPVQVESFAENPNDYENYVPPAQYSEQDLTPRLLALLHQNKLRPYNPEQWPSVDAHTTRRKDAPLPTQGIPELALADMESTLADQRVEALALGTRLVRQTSYTELSRHSRVHDRASEPAEESIDEMAADAAVSTALPGSADTGNALHLVLEHYLGQNDLAWCADTTEPAELSVRVKSELDDSGALRPLLREKDPVLQAEKIAAACQAAQRMVRLALHDAYDLSHLGGPQALCLHALSSTHRLAEQEFQLRAEAGWVHGFMDLVFRVPQPDAAHPWRYFVLDWKTNTLDQYTEERIARSIADCHYDLQARLYCHALDAHLRGLLGPTYDPIKNLGGAVYVYLRAYEHAEHAPLWLHSASAEEDATYVRELLATALNSAPGTKDVQS